MVIALAATSFKRSLFTTPSPKYDDFLVGNSAYIPSSFESIATATGTGSSGTITFSSIPSTYKHLQIRANLRCSAAAVNTNMYMQLNSDTGSNYAYHRLTGDGAAVTAAGSATQTSIFVGGVPSATTTANVMATVIIDIHDYASTTKYKTSRAIFGRNSNNAYTENIILESGLWQSTSAVNSISFVLDNPSFTTATTIALYGIKGD